MGGPWHPLSSIEALLSDSRLTVGEAFTELVSLIAMRITTGNNRGCVARCNCQNTGEYNYHHEQQGWSDSKVSSGICKSLRWLKAHVGSPTSS